MRRKSSSLLIICLIACILVGLFIALPRFWPRPAEPTPTPTSQPSTPTPAPRPTPSAAPDPTPAPKPEPKPQLTSEPVRMYIPKLSADAEIQGTELDETNTMEVVPSASVISWMKAGVIPGNDGNAFLAGHNKWRGERGDLINMDTLAVGDEMIIDYADGTSLTFLLESVFVYALDTAPADLIMDMDRGGEARVTVITCKDPFNPATGTSDNRIIAIFKEKGVFTTPDPPVTPFPTLSPARLTQ